jgi:hypothetical protein
MLRTVAFVLAGITVVITAALAIGAWRWNAGTRELRARLDEGRVPLVPPRVDLRELSGLPPPVAHMLRTALTDGQPMIAGARVRHAGTFNMGEEVDNWRPFTSDQLVVTRRPGFDWDARVRMLPGVIVHVHDAYVSGEGVLRAALFGLIPVMEMSGGRAVAEGELMRFFAETAWYPTALLPSQGVTWTPVDHRSADATLADGDLRLTLRFTFGHDGLIERVRAAARGRLVGDVVVPTPWEGRFWNYVIRDGMRIPLEGEVSWIMPEGPRPYWRGRIERVAYEWAR